jgi:cytochrome c
MIVRDRRARAIVLEAGLEGTAVRLLRLSLPLLIAFGSSAAMAQDGAAIFRQRCTMCHVTVAGQKPGLGPNLFGLVGRKAASTPFLYSPALKKSGIKWDKATLDKFLTAPSKLVPGTFMNISLPKPSDRAALIAYLATLK